MRKLLVLAMITALAVAVGAPAIRSSGVSNQRTKVVRISTRKLPKLGTVLVNSKGLTLYMFVQRWMVEGLAAGGVKG